MSAPGESTPIVFHDDAEMQNGGNGVDGSGQIVPQVVQPDQVEEAGTLVPQAVLEPIPVQSTPPEQSIPLFDGPRIFLHSPQYHWHAAAAGGGLAVDQEARERIVSLADLLDRFGRRTELREEELWARSERLEEGSQMIRRVEPMEARLARLEKQVQETDTRTLANQLKIASNRQYLDHHLYQMNETLLRLERRVQIVEEITKNWNRMQQELTMINTEIAAVREAQQALTTLMEGISTRLEAIPEMEPAPEEFGDSDADRLYQAWDFTGSGVPQQPMERLPMIPEGVNAEAAPSASPALGWPMAPPKAPVPTQSGVGNVTFKERVEQTIAKMRAPPYETAVDRSRTATPSIPFQTMTLGTGGVTQPAVQSTATSAPVVPQEARIGGLKLEMPEKYTGSRTPAVSGWLTKMERYFRLMNYPADIWVDVIATRVTDAAQAWLDKALQDVHLGRRPSWVNWTEFRQEMEQAFTPLSEVEHARRKLMEIKMGKNVSGYIQAFRTQMYKVPEMTQEEAFSLFMRGLEPRIREQIGYHVDGDLGRAMAMAEKADVWRSRSEGQTQKGQSKQKAGGSGQSGQGQNQKGNKKPWWGKKGSGNAVQGKGTVNTDGASSSGSVAAVTSGTNTQGQQNQQKKGPKRKFPCPGCGGKHQFKDCPQWKSVQALLAKEKKPGN